jgi:Glyoxalase-like domain
MELVSRAGILFLMTAFLGAADLTVDHVTVAGTDLSQLQARLAAVGIPSEYGGPHSNGATQMALASFPDGSYLELIALQASPNAKAVADHYWSKQIQGNAGPTAWAVRANDVAAEAGRLRTAGIVVSATAHLGRERPDGMRLDWETARVGTEPNGTFFPFLIRDITPREARAFPKGQPATQNFSGVKRVVIAVRDLKAAARYRQAYGLPAAVEQLDASFGAHLAWFAGTPVVLAAPLNARSWLTQRIERFGEGPCAFVLGYRMQGGYKAVSETRWFGAQVEWFDTQKLGWHLGFEK